MNTNNRWLLPEGVDEILPPKAILLEQICRKIIDLYTTWGYEFVIPPINTNLPFGLIALT